MSIAKANPEAFAAGQSAQRMVGGYFAHSAAMIIARDPRAKNLAPDPPRGKNLPHGYVRRKDGGEHIYHFLHYLQLGADDPTLSEDFSRIWLSSSISEMGDILSRNDYFDRAPILELVRHLRNGIAHGNRFRIDKPENLKKYPAHNGEAKIRGDKTRVFEIAKELNGTPVLFSYMEAGDVLEVLMSVSLHLIIMGNGDDTSAKPSAP